jgi:hypothetical protein
MYACIHLTDQLTWRCEKHPDPSDCPDVLIIHNQRFDESAIAKRHCDSPVTMIGY